MFSSPKIDAACRTISQKGVMSEKTYWFAASRVFSLWSL